MKCEDYLFLIDDLVEGELDARSAEQINLHLFTCRECAAQCELLREEREIYGRYLFGVEPPSDLKEKFQAKLKTGKEGISKPAVISAGTSNWGWKISNLFRLYPSVAMAGGLLLLFAVNFALLRLVINYQNNGDDYTAAGKKESSAAKSPNNAAEINENKQADLSAATTGKRSDKFLSSKIRKLNDKTKFSDLFKTSINTKNASVVNRIKAAANTVAGKKNDVPDKAPFKSERLQALELKNLETETARQVEKIELFLRTFRNARAVEDGATYDVSYEKRQARKLLEKNVQIRLTAETYGNFYTEELLSKAEPLLLEIANLENTASSQKVLDIKERLRNQNLIASFQAY